MEISNNRQLKDLSKDFEKQFPYLKTAFYKAPYRKGRSCNESYLLDPELTVGSVRQQSNFGYFTLDEDMSVGTFEQLIWDLYGLHVQVFRKSYGKWLQTWATDNWSLRDQNQRSQIMGEKGPSANTKSNYFGGQVSGVRV